jgi:hypothetical protein
MILLRPVAAALVGCLAACVGAVAAERGVVVRPCPAGAVQVEPGRRMQDEVDRAPAGAAFCLKDGVHRMQVVRPKAGQRFYGEGGAVLDGARLLSEFKREGSYFVAEIPEGGWWRPRGVCTKPAPGCDLPQALFFDDRPLVPVSRKEAVAPGHFFFDQLGRRMYFADDPAGRKVEAAVARFAFGGTAPRVEVHNLTIEKYASVPQEGAIQAQQAADWTIENCEVRLNSAGGIAAGRGTRVRSCNVHHNGQIGITGAGEDIVIENNLVRVNNTRGYDDGWEAGGVKIALGARVVFRGNHVNENSGPGLWCDGDCRDTLYEGNVVQRNQGAGIYHEISFDAVIRNNLLADNGLNEGWFWGSQILVAGSEGVDVHDNRLAVPPEKCGIMLIDQGRDDRSEIRASALYKTRNNSVHDNDILFEGNGCSGGASDVGPGHENYAIIENGNNRFDRNVYRIPRATGRHVFVWGHLESNWETVRRSGFETNGKVVLY